MTSIRFNTAKTALKARVHDSSASVLLGPEPDPLPLTLPTSPIDDMPMLAESLIECPAILSLWILCERQQGIIWCEFSPAYSIPPPAQPRPCVLPKAISWRRQSSMPMSA